MRGIYCLLRIPRAKRKVKASGRTEMLPALPLKVKVGKKTHATGLSYLPQGPSGWRRVVFLGEEAVVLELGRVGKRKDWLYLAFLPEDRANAIRHLVGKARLWTLREFIEGFDKLAEDVRGAWPEDWYVEGEPRVGASLSRRHAVVELGGETQDEWTEASTEKEAKALLRQD
jgi:hypothetical protein